MSKKARRALLLGLSGAALLVAGCTATYAIQPVSKGPVGVATSAGLQLYADADAWQWYPVDLPDYMTPVAVRIINNTDKEISLTYGSFALVDNQGFRYAAINPFSGASSEPGREELMGRAEKGAHSTRPLVAALGPEGIAAALSAPDQPVETMSQVQRETRVAAKRVRRFTVHRGHRFYVYPRYRSHFRYYSSWPGIVYYPPTYGAYVYGWGPGYYPPSPEVKERALPEGVIQPGGEVSGFLYFQNASQRAERLELIWNAVTPSGQPVARLDIRFVVVPS